MDGVECLHGAAGSLPSPSTDRMHDFSVRDLSHRVRSAGGRQTDGDCGDCGATSRDHRGKSRSWKEQQGIAGGKADRRNHGLSQETNVHVLAALVSHLWVDGIVINILVIEINARVARI